MTLLFIAVVAIVLAVVVDEVGLLRGHAHPQLASASGSLKSITIDLDDRDR